MCVCDVCCARSRACALGAAERRGGARARALRTKNARAHTRVPSPHHHHPETHSAMFYVGDRVRASAKRLCEATREARDAAVAVRWGGLFFSRCLLLLLLSCALHCLCSAVVLPPLPCAPPHTHKKNTHTHQLSTAVRPGRAV